jgi:hypothetical protein
VQVVVHAEDDTATVVREVFTLRREEPLAPDTLGLRLGEAKDLLAAVQDTLVAHQVATALSTHSGCPDCGVPRRHKDSRPIVMKTLFGTLRLDSPRWWHCGCQPQMNTTFSPLAAILPQRSTPELSYLQARFAGLVSYGISADLLGEVLPLGRALHASTVRRQVQATAQRLEDELGDERSSFIDTCPRDREELPRPRLPLVVGLDGGYVHSESGKNRERRLRRRKPGDLRTADLRRHRRSHRSPRPGPPALIKGRPPFLPTTVFPTLRADRLMQQCPANWVRHQGVSPLA